MSWTPPPGYDSLHAFVDALRDFLDLPPLYGVEKRSGPICHTLPTAGSIPIQGGVQRSRPRTQP